MHRDQVAGSTVAQDSIRTGGFCPEAFDRLARFEAGHWWFRARNRIILWVLRSRAGSFRRFLEVGCGTGFVLKGIREAFPEVTLAGTEYLAEGLAHAAKRVPGVRLIQLDARMLQDEALWDVVGAFDVIEHIVEDELVLTNLARSLVPGGRLLVTVPQHRWLWSDVDVDACHVRRYTRRELVAKVKARGLRVEYVTSFVTLLIPLMWWSRRRQQGGVKTTRSEFDIPRWLNQALSAVMALEFALLRLGLRLPVGGSLLVLARK